MEFLSSQAVKQRLTENERWRAIGMMQNGSTQLNVARQFDLSQSGINRLWNCHQQTEHVTDFKTTMQEPMLHMLSKITCSFVESRLSHGQRSPQTCLRLNICGTFSGDVSGDGLTRSLMHSRRNGAGSSKQPSVGSSGAWGVVSRARRRMEALLAIGTSVKLIY